LQGETITSVEVEATGATVDPGSPNNNVSISHTGNTIGSTSAATRDSYAAGTWTHVVADGDPDEGTMFNCGPDSTGSTEPEACSGLYRVTVAPTPSGLASCGDLGTPDLTLDGTFTTARRYRPEAECTNGSGRFTLYPLVLRDADGDGQADMIFRGVQTSGTGVLTSRSSVTSISVVSAPGPAIRVIKAAKTYRFDSSDQLVDAGNNSVALSGTTNFSTGTVGGNPDFVVVEGVPDDSFEYQVDMTWSCESTGGTADPAAKGYQFALSTLGLYIPQKLVMRPRFNVTPKRIEWELYGDPRARITVPVETTTEGHAFAFELGQLSLDGVVLSAGAQTATVRLDLLQFTGVDFGTPGTYTINVE
jgi:hypothetical protein